MSAEPTSAQAWFEQGMERVGMSRFADTRSDYEDDLEAALEAFDRAVELDPSFTDALWQRGLALATLDRHGAALASFAEVARLKPGDPDVELATAKSLARKGRDETAVAAFERALAARPGDEEAHYGLAEALTRLGRDEAALASWDAVLSLPDNRTLRLGEQKVRVLTGDFRRARARLSRATCLARLGRPEAQAAFAEALADPTDTGELKSEALREHEAARAALAGLLEARQAEPVAWQRAGQDFLAAKLPVRALEAFETQLRLAPGDFQGWFGKAEAHAQGGQLDEAIAAYRKCLELSPGFLGASARLKVVEAEAEAQRSPRGRWTLMGHDTFAREDYRVGEFATREAAEAALREKEASSAATQDEALRDTYWIVPPR